MYDQQTMNVEYILNKSNLIVCDCCTMNQLRTKDVMINWQMLNQIAKENQQTELVESQSLSVYHTVSLLTNVFQISTDP